MQAIRDIEYTYDFNRIESKSLKLDETLHIIEKGLTIGGKLLNDHLKAINHQAAIHYICDLVQHDTIQNKHIILNTYSKLFAAKTQVPTDISQYIFCNLMVPGMGSQMFIYHLS
jgi:Fic family protein